MQAAGPQGPLPATDAVIEGLPRVKLDEDAIGELTRLGLPADRQKRVHLKIALCARMTLSPEMRSCEFHASEYCRQPPVDEQMLTARHIFHVDCLQPLLKTNGSCPVWSVSHNQR